MIRCTIEIIPGGVESHERRAVIGVVEIANVGGSATTGIYKVVAKKNLPFAKAKNTAWREVFLGKTDKDTLEVLDDILTGDIVGFPRVRLGPYDLLYRALKALGLEARNR